MSANSIHKAAALVALSLLCGVASADTTCSLSTGTVVFGSYDVFNPGSLDTSATLVASCSRSGGPQNVTVDIGIGPGAYGGNTANRKMKAISGDLLNYNLFKDAGKTSVWGQVSGLDTFRQTLVVPNKSSAQLTATIFGRIPAGQNVAKGDYTDNVVVTVMP